MIRKAVGSQVVVLNDGTEKLVCATEAISLRPYLMQDPRRYTVLCLEDRQRSNFELLRRQEDSQGYAHSFRPLFGDLPITGRYT